MLNNIYITIVTLAAIWFIGFVLVMLYAGFRKKQVLVSEAAAWPVKLYKLIKG